MSYPELKGICKKAIENELCFGCNRLEMQEFTGLEKCKYVVDPKEKCKEILGIQERLDI